LTIIPFLLTGVVLLIYLSNKNEEWQKAFGWKNVHELHEFSRII
jgi:hypothetical protein